MRAMIIAGLAAIVGITLIFGSWYTIDQRERGVILRNGKLVGTATPGLGFKVPMIDTGTAASGTISTVRPVKASM